MEGLEINMSNNLEWYEGKKVFLTGHTGFKGAWLSEILLNTGAEVTGFSLTPNTEVSLYDLLGLSSRMNSVIGDIRNYSLLKEIYDETQPDVVFHLAAQPLVRDSYEDPRYTYETNVMGTVNLLECIRTSRKKPISVLNVTTDKVYHNNEWEWGYREIDSLDGFDPYSNSKSCSELVTHSYINSFFKDVQISVSTARAGNVIGGGDFSKDRIIPDCVRAVEQGLPLGIRNPYSTRPYQHVLEPLIAYLMIVEEQAKNPSLSGYYNIGPDDKDCVATGTLVELFSKQWGEGFSWENQSDKNAPHEANFLKLDCSKAKSTFQWRPHWGVEEAIKKTVEWTKVYLEKEEILSITNQQIEDFITGAMREKENN